MQVVVNGLVVHYEVTGKGPLVLILHGWADESKNWRQVARELAKDNQVLIPDLPGFGGSERPNEPWGLDDYAKFVSDFLRKIQAGTVYAVIGHSNGGAIAVRGLANQSFTAEKLVLLASAGIRSEYKGRKAVLRYIAKIGKQFALVLPRSIQHKLRRKLYTTIGSDMLVAEGLQETFKKVVTDDIRNDAAKITVPTLLLYGDQDVSTPLRYGRMLQAAIKGSRLEVLPGAGHFVPRDAYDKTMAAIKRFLS